VHRSPPDGVAFTQATGYATSRESVERPTFRRSATYLAGFAFVDPLGGIALSAVTPVLSLAVISSLAPKGSLLIPAAGRHFETGL
jgi:hypothetical protein